jgi:elongation factor P
VTLPPEIVGDAKNFLVENGTVTVTFVEEKAVSIELPSSVVLKVSDAPEGRGDGNRHHRSGPALHQDGREDQD